MTCNHEKFLESTELECRRIAKSANDGTQAQKEWLKTADALLQRRSEHLAVCKKRGEKK